MRNSRGPRRFSTVPRSLQEAVVVAVAGVIPLVAAVRLRCVLCASVGDEGAREARGAGSVAGRPEAPERG
jgi:hypothetical protein